MSKETRTVRPYLGLDRVSGIFQGAVLHFGPDFCLADSTINVDLPTHEFLLRGISLEWTPDDESFIAFRRSLAKANDAVEVDAEALSIIVLASSSFLKLADVVFECPLSRLDAISRVVQLDSLTRVPAFRAPHTGFRVDVYLALNQDVHPQPLRPSKLGTWLSHVGFHVHTSLSAAVLPPTPLTNEIRDDLNLLSKTVKYIDFQDHDIFQPFTSQHAPIFYVDVDILAQLNARKTASTSKALQIQLALDFIAAVIRRAAAGSEDFAEYAYEDLKGTLLGNVLQIAGGPGQTDKQMNNLLTSVKEDPERVIARTEHFVDLVTGFTQALKENEA